MENLKYINRRNVYAKTIKILFISFLLLTSNNIYSQESGNIVGVVVDQDFGDAQFGANVFIEGIARGAATDINGEYSITDVEPGTYTVNFSMIGFQKQTITGVEVKPGATVKIDVVLSS